MRKLVIFFEVRDLTKKDGITTCFLSEILVKNMKNS